MMMMMMKSMTMTFMMMMVTMIMMTSDFDLLSVDLKTLKTPDGNDDSDGKLS